MKLKKQIAIIVTCAVVLTGIFFTISYIGGNNKTSNSKNSNITTEQNKDNSSETTKNSDNLKQDSNSEQTSNDKEIKFSKEDVKEGYYVIKKDDTLYSIARAYMPNHDTKDVVKSILDNNSMTEKDPIVEGKKLVIPYEIALEEIEVNSSKIGHDEHTKYTIKAGDTLYKIAKENLPKADLTEAIKELKAHNNITDENSIKASDVICIPIK